jgi:DNA integrity scanning protein DisA with diadenylate cyclase activity
MFGITNIKAIAAIKTVATVVGFAICCVAVVILPKVLDLLTILWLVNIFLIGWISYFMYQIYLSEGKQRNKDNG